MLVDDGIHINVSLGFDRESHEVGFMSFGVGGEGTEQFLGLVKGLLDGNGFLGPVDRGVESFSQGSPRITFSFPRFMTYVEGDSAGYSSDIEE